LISILLVFVADPVSRDSAAARLLCELLVIFVILVALVAVFTTTRLRLLALTVVVPMLGVNWTGYVFTDLPLALGYHALAAVFFSFTAALILWTVSRETQISADSINGALCGYLLAGVAFGHVYCLVESIAPGSFLGSEALADQLRSEARRRFLLTYFSFTTLTTLGYGDIVPATDVARSLCAVEAVLGQFYVAVLIAEFVGKRVAAMAARGGDTEIAAADGRSRHRGE
jgi:hypothetical protein